jgi:hypothetical protein
MFLNEGALNKILGVGGALAGASIAGHDFMDIANHASEINPLEHPDISTQNTMQGITAATKIPFYAAGGALAGTV